MWWYLLLAVLIAAFAAGLVYVSSRVARLPFVQRLAKGRRGVARGLCLAAFAALFGVLCLVFDAMNALVIFVHLFLFWALCDLAALIVRKVRRTPPERADRSRNLAGVFAVLLCAAYLTAGWFAAHHVGETDYSLETDKLAAPVRIVAVTDAHLGAILHADDLARYVDEINALQPDIVVIVGDFVDDDTPREDMLGGCAALAGLQATYGVYFVYGNHDRGYYDEEGRGWTNAEFRAALDAAGVFVLEDECAELPCGVTVVGRADKSSDRPGSPRASIDALLAAVDRGTYLVVLDHQPADFAAEAAAGADLVLCGHTHGGQFIPLGPLSVWTGLNDAWYGHERRDGTDFIVSSGISNWTFQFKTGCHSEYVVVDVTGYNQF